jgi:neuronal guanine nucleotide exchange factor
LTGLPLTDIEETYTSSLFQTEPLYQFYDNDNPSSVSEDSDAISEHDPEHEHENVYESVENLLSPIARHSTRKAPKTSRCSAMDIVISNTGRRSLWAELPEVIESGLLKTISSEDKKLQEAMFEVISSEASYLKSLNILISHFVQSSKFSGETSVLSKRDQRILFSEVILVILKFKGK